MANKSWREIAIAAGLTDTSSGSWKRRAAFALNKVEGRGSWVRRIAGETSADGKSWNQSARKALSDD